MGIWTAIKMTIVLTLLTGIIYPIAIAGMAELIFPFQAHGSLLTHDNHVVGSALIGQNFSAAGYFHGRPSAAGDKGYDATSSSGSNLGTTNKAFIDTVRTRVKALREDEPGLHNHGEYCNRLKKCPRPRDLARLLVRAGRTDREGAQSRRRDGSRAYSGAYERSLGRDPG
jgi:hypothetical protein